MKATLHVTSKRLGNGTSASVYEATLDGSLPVAAKVGNYRDDSRRQIRREARRYAKLIHPNIIKCFAVSETPSCVVLITEYMSGGSLFHNLANHRAATASSIPKPSALQIAIYIVRALHHIHSQGFSCGDVKSLNILLSDELRPDGYLETGCTVKFCDFGLSKRLYHNYDASSSSGNLDLWNSTAFDPDAKNIAGTFAYLAPECFEKPANTAQGMIAADVYALGVVLWELITGKIPWDGLSIGRLMKMMRENRSLEFAIEDRKVAAGKLVALVNQCWDKTPHKRPNTTEILHALQNIYQQSTEYLLDSPTNVMHHAANVARTNKENADSGGNYSDNTRNPNNNNIGSSAEQADRDLDPESLHDSLSSDESTAIASINSDDEDLGADDRAFDISVSLLPEFASEVRRRKNLHAMKKARRNSRKRDDDDYSSSSDESRDSRDYQDDSDDREDVAVFGNVDDIVVFDNPSKQRTFYKKSSNMGRVPTIREIPSEYPLIMDESDGNDNNNNTTGKGNYDRVPTIREIQSEAILPNVDSYRDGYGHSGSERSCSSSDDEGSNYSSSIGDEDDINIGVQVDEEVEIPDYKHGGSGRGRASLGNLKKPQPSVADAAHASSSAVNAKVDANHYKPPVPPVYPANKFSYSYLPQHKKKMANGEKKTDGCYIPEEFPAAGPGWLEATNELSEYEYTFQDKSTDSLPPPDFPYLPRKPPQNNNIAKNQPARSEIETEPARRTASAPLLAEQPKKPTHEAYRPASQQTSQAKPQQSANQANLYAQSQRQSPPPVMRRFYSAAPSPLPTPSQVRRQYISPAVEHKAIEEELEMFEDLDANALVLGSVMKFSKFVQQNKT